MQLLLSASVTAEEAVGLWWKEVPPVGIRVGDLVFRRGHGLWTQYFIRASSREKRFSHVGIVVRVCPSVLLLHSDANDITGVGKVRVEEWNGFFNDALECAVYRYSGPMKTAETFASRGLARLGVPFDSAFDMSSTNALYCTELVREVVNEAVGTNVVGFTVLKGRRIIAIDDVYRGCFYKVFDSRDTPRRRRVSR